jgi:type II secretory pathway pseudopilin PulG
MQRAGGFTLVETLASFTILSLVMTGLFVAVGGAIRSDSTSQNQSTSLQLANAHLAALGVTAPIVQGVSKGSFGRDFYWEQSTVPLQDGNPQDKAFLATAAHWITLSVWPTQAAARLTSPTVVLTTLKLSDAKSILRPQSP